MKRTQHGLSPSKFPAWSRHPDQVDLRCDLLGLSRRGLGPDQQWLRLVRSSSLADLASRRPQPPSMRMSTAWAVPTAQAIAERSAGPRPSELVPGPPVASPGRQAPSLLACRESTPGSRASTSSRKWSYSLVIHQEGKHMRLFRVRRVQHDPLVDSELAPGRVLTARLDHRASNLGHRLGRQAINHQHHPAALRAAPAGFASSLLVSKPRQVIPSFKIRGTRGGHGRLILVSASDGSRRPICLNGH